MKNISKSFLILAVTLTPYLSQAVGLACPALFWAVTRSLKELMKPNFADPQPRSPWLERENKIALTKIFSNISPSDAKTGDIIAATNRAVPQDYYYHWVRDAGITVVSLVLQFK